MAFTDYIAPIKRVGQQHRASILMFSGALLLLLAGDLCLRRILKSQEAAALAGAAGKDAFWAAIPVVLAQPSGWLGLGLIGAGLCVWLALLLRHQLSFFYPLWGISTLLLLLISWAASGSINPKALFGGALVVIGAGLLMRGGHSI